MKNCNGTFISLNAFSYRLIVLNFITIKHSWYQQIICITIEFFCQQALRDSKHVVTVNEALINFTVYDECLF